MRVVINLKLIKLSEAFKITIITRGPIGLTRIASLRIKACDSGNQDVL